MTTFQIILIVGLLITVVAAICLHCIGKRFDKYSLYDNAEMGRD